MAKALQQCGQAAQNALSAAQNEDNKQQLTNQDTPKPTPLRLKPFKQDGNGKDRDSDNGLAKNFGQGQGPEGSEGNIAMETEAPDFPQPAEVIEMGGAGSDDAGIYAEADAGSVLGPIDSSKLKNDEEEAKVLKRIRYGEYKDEEIKEWLKTGKIGK